MSSSHYIHLKLNCVPTYFLEEVSEKAFEVGAAGVSEDLNFTQLDRDYKPTVLNSDVTVLNVFFELSKKEVLLTLLQQPFWMELKPELLIEKNKDWMSEWKKHFKAFLIHKDLWVYPVWEKSKVKENQRALVINPAMAFGTGTHSTTKLCLEALDELEGHYTSALDMGAGSGVLSILMRQKLSAQVVACEIDTMACENCKENLILNECADVKVVEPKDLDLKRFDLVVANIIDGVLLKIKQDLLSRVGSKLILSGVLEENKEEVLQAFTKNTALVLKKETQHTEWVCLEFDKVEA